MRNHAVIVAVAGVLGLAAAGVAVGQQRVGPIYPPNPSSNPPGGPARGPGQAQSGYDPFQLNPSTGRFDYVPIPYEPQQPGQAYNPWQFNWHTGRFDYVPVPGDWWNQPYTPGKQVDGTASNYVDTRVDTQALPAAARIGPSQPTGTTPGARPAPRAVPMPPPPSKVRPVAPPRVPTTGPSTAPSMANPPGARQAKAPTAAPRAGDRDVGEWVTLNGVTGRWEYDYSRGKWIFVLPPD